jgi:VWFA-related protein
MTTERRTASHFPVGAILVAPLLAVLLYASHPAADAQTAQQPPRFQTRVELVLLDVSVLDAERRPVRGLAAADFTILEDGRPQTIQTFTAVDVPGRSEEAAVAPWTREVVPDVRSNEEFKQGRIVVLVLDDATPMPAPDVLRAKNVARRAIDALGPDDLAAVVFPFNQKEGVDFTHDRARLLAAVDKYRGAIDYTPCTILGESVPFDKFNPCAATLYSAMIGCLTDVAQYLTALPDRRKALMFVSVGMPLDVEEATPKIYSAGDADAAGITRQLTWQLTDAFRAAQRANVAIYGLDPGGLRAPGEGGVHSADDSNPGRINREFLHAVALNTGGFVVTNTNSPDAGISQILLENSSYYLIGYVPASSRAEGKFRRIEVRVNRPGITVRTRNGYFEPLAGKEPSRGEASGARAALAGMVPKSDLGMQAMAAAFAQPGKPEAAVAFVLAVRQPAPSRASHVVQELDVRVKAYSPDGRERASVRITAKATLSPSLREETIYEVASKLDLKPGRYQLRFAAEGSVGGYQPQPDAPAVAMLAVAETLDRKSGSVYLDLDVPDFSQPVALSAIMLSSKPGLHTGVDKDVRAVLPIVPTTLRDFTSDDQATAFARVYQGGKKPVEAVKIVARIVDGNGTTVFQTAETLEPNLFAKTRSADYLVDLPIEQLKKGPHLLTIEATAGQATSRSERRFTKR